jgi:hypothetical protein
MLKARKGRAAMNEKRHARFAAVLSLCLGGGALGCGGPTSNPTPMPTAETWFVVPVLCSNCLGLTDVQVDRSVSPPRARLQVGTRTGVRAAAKAGCGADASSPLSIERWEASDPTVVRVEATAPDSAIVTAVAVGTSRLTAERRLPAGGTSLSGLRDSFRADPPCPAQPELLLEVVP